MNLTKIEFAVMFYGRSTIYQNTYDDYVDDYLQFIGDSIRFYALSSRLRGMYRVLTLLHTFNEEL